MEFGASQIGLIGFAILASSIVQGAVGFAVALVAIPLLLQAGLELPQSIFVVLICAIVQNALGLRQTWKDTPIRNLWGWACWRAMLIPPGFLLMQWMESYSKSELRQLFGIILIIIMPSLRTAASTSMTVRSGPQWCGSTPAGSCST